MRTACPLRSVFLASLVLAGCAGTDDTDPQGSGSSGMATGGMAAGGMAAGGMAAGGMAAGGMAIGGVQGLGGVGGVQELGGSPTGGAPPNVECAAGIASGAPCDPAVDTHCSRTQTTNPRDCDCGMDGLWTCTPTTGSGGTGGAGETGGSGGTGGAGETGGAGGSTFVEDDGTDCPLPSLPDPGSLTSNTRLPDPFTKLDGTRLAARSEWRCRRQELKRQAERYVYGTKPPKPESVSGTVSAESITVNVSDQGRSTTFSVSVDLPTSGSGPYPAIVGLASGFLPFPLKSSIVQGEGVAIVTYDPYVVGNESATRNNKQGAFYDLYGADSSTGLLVAWAWGVSRIIDVIEQSGGSLLRAEAVGVSGCSRFGKGAFTIGAFDQRIALTLPIESGTGGVPIWRGLAGEGAQTPNSAYGETYWLGDAFSSFTSNVNALPIDTHEIVAMIAPRGLFVMDNPHIANLGPRSAHAAVLAGAEVYQALGAGDAISYVSAVADGGHCNQRAEWDEPLRRSIRRFLTGTGSEPGVISAASGASANLADWRTWTTPTLE